MLSFVTRHSTAIIAICTIVLAVAAVVGVVVNIVKPSDNVSPWCEARFEENFIPIAKNLKSKDSATRKAAISQLNNLTNCEYENNSQEKVAQIKEVLNDFIRSRVGIIVRGDGIKAKCLNENEKKPTQCNSIDFNAREFVTLHQAFEVLTSNAKIQDENLPPLDFYGLNLYRVDFRGFNFGNANLDRAYLYGADLRGADLSRVTSLESAMLTHALYDADAKFPPRIAVPKDMLEFEDLADKNLRKIDWRNMDLQNVKLRGADLEGAQLGGINLSGANLQGANLKDANLEKAILNDGKAQGANFQDANLRGAKLHCLNLQHSNLDDVKWKGAEYNNCTKWPFNFPIPPDAINVDEQ